MALRVLHLVGSPTSDFHADLSRLYAADALEATADPDRHVPHLAWVDPGGRWRFPADLSRAAIAAATPLEVGEAVAHVLALGVDVMVPQMFCLPGMTAYRALFDVLAVPYVGNPADVMALGAHKARTRAVVADAGVDVPRGELLAPGARPTLPLPLVVKPVDSDNSLGVALVRAPGELDAALAEAARHGGGVLVEEYVELGREVRCGIVERDGELVGLPLEEYGVDPDDKPVRGYADKLDRGEGGEIDLVAKDGVRAWMVDPADPLTARVHAAARAAHVAMGCRDYSLFDFRVDPAGRPRFLEAGLYCSFARRSVVAMMADAAGTPVGELFAEALERAAARG